MPDSWLLALAGETLYLPHSRYTTFLFLSQTSHLVLEFNSICKKSTGLLSAFGATRKWETPSHPVLMRKERSGVNFQGVNLHLDAGTQGQSVC